MSDFKPPVLSSVAAEMPPATAGVSPPPPPPPRPRARRPRTLLLGAVVAAVVGVLAVALALRAKPKSTPGQAIRTATVERRDFVRTLRVTGTVEAIQSYVVAAPTLTGGNLNSLVITSLVKSGTRVKKGDLLVEFDRQNQIKNALDRQAEYRDLLEQINKKRAEQAVARAKDETELHQADDAAKAAELETRRNEVVSKIDAEKNLANLEEARARLTELKSTFQLKRQAAAAELRILEIQRDRARSAMLHAQSNSEKMAIHAPLDGVVVLNTIWKGGQIGEVQEGDEVRPGVPFMQVMDPKTMQVRARVNQADIPELHADEPVEVRLDAYPGLLLPGRLERIAAIGVTSTMSQKVRSFTALFSIQGSDPRLMPDLTAAVNVELQRVPNALVVPRDALYSDAGGSYVWVRHGGSFDREPVKVAVLGESEAALASGVSAGDVLLRNRNAGKDAAP